MGLHCLLTDRQTDGRCNIYARREINVISSHVMSSLAIAIAMSVCCSDGWMDGCQGTGFCLVVHSTFNYNEIGHIIQIQNTNTETRHTTQTSPTHGKKKKNSPTQKRKRKTDKCHAS